LPGRPEERTNAQTDAENTGQINRRRGGSIVAAEGEKSRQERALKKKMLINDVRTGNVYENKQKDNNLPEGKSDISTQRNSISYTKTRILPKPSAFFHGWSAGERIPRLKMQKLEGRSLGAGGRRGKGLQPLSKGSRVTRGLVTS
jgi:hypothetical protein